MVQEMEFIFNDRSIRGRTHVIGFSLGAHTAGNAGMYFALEANKESTNTSTSFCTKLHQISGLDPAGPLFENVPPSIRLDPSDACYVDVIHTNAGSLPTLGLGIRRPCGNVDFYPNGGSRQPECRHLIIGAFNQCELGKNIIHCSCKQVKPRFTTTSRIITSKKNEKLRNLRNFRKNSER